MALIIYADRRKRVQMKSAPSPHNNDDPTTHNDPFLSLMQSFKITLL